MGTHAINSFGTLCASPNLFARGLSLDFQSVWQDEWENEPRHTDDDWIDPQEAEDSDSWVDLYLTAHPDGNEDGDLNPNLHFTMPGTVEISSSAEQLGENTIFSQYGGSTINKRYYTYISPEDKEKEEKGNESKQKRHVRARSRRLCNKRDSIRRTT
jgi:hypothetical protein